MTTETLFDLKDRLNWQQACTLLGCGKTKFYELVNTGKLSSRRVGKKGLWVSRQDCEKMLQENPFFLDQN